jgi:hypothetical protein
MYSSQSTYVEVDWSGIKLNYISFYFNTRGLRWIHKQDHNGALVFSAKPKHASVRAAAGGNRVLCGCSICDKLNKELAHEFSSFIFCQSGESAFGKKKIIHIVNNNQYDTVNHGGTSSSAAGMELNGYIWYLIHHRYPTDYCVRICSNFKRELLAPGRSLR